MYEKNEVGLPQSIVEVLQKDDEIKKYFRPSEIQQAFCQLAQECEGIEGVSARFVSHGDEEAIAFELALDDADGQTAIFFDGVHTNEVIGGRMVVELFEEAARCPQILEDLGVNRLVYHNMNPSEMEMNEPWFMKGAMDVKSYLKGAHRSARNVDWGYTLEAGGKEAGFEATKVAMRLYDLYQPDVAIPLHNSGAGDAFGYINGMVDVQTAQRLSAFLITQDVPGLSEAGVDVEERAPGIYHLLSSNRMAGYAMSLAYAELRNVRAAALEVPYFKPREGADGVLEEVEAEHVRVLATKVETLLNKRKEWELPASIPADAQHSLDAVDMHHTSLVVREAAANRGGGSRKTEFRVAVLFYPALMLGHVLRAARRLDDAGYGNGNGFAEYAKQCDELIDEVAEELELYLEAPTRRHQVSTYMGAAAIVLSQGNEASEDSRSR